MKGCNLDSFQCIAISRLAGCVAAVCLFLPDKYQAGFCGLQATQKKQAAAATVIQAAWRGHLLRAKLKSAKPGKAKKKKTEKA